MSESLRKASDLLDDKLLDWVTNGKPVTGQDGIPVLNEDGTPMRRELTAAEVTAIMNRLKMANIQPQVHGGNGMEELMKAVAANPTFPRRVPDTNMEDDDAATEVA